MRSGRWTWRRGLGAAGLTLAGVIGLGAVLHLPVARPWLARLGAACPVRNVSADEVDALRRPALRALQGTTLAPRRPALGLALAAMGVEQAREWARRQGHSCVEKVRGLRYLQCQAPAQDLDLALAFDGRGVLVAVDAMRKGLSAESAARLGAGITQRLQTELGSPTEAAGEWSPAFLGAGPLRTTIVRYRFKDYAALVTATQVPGSGVIVREQYLSLTAG
jgi:hypothetical protein